MGGSSQRWHITAYSTHYLHITVVIGANDDGLSPLTLAPSQTLGDISGLPNQLATGHVCFHVVGKCEHPSSPSKPQCMVRCPPAKEFTTRKQKLPGPGPDFCIPASPTRGAPISPTQLPATSPTELFGFCQLKTALEICGSRGGVCLIMLELCNLAITVTHTCNFGGFS